MVNKTLNCLPVNWMGKLLGMTPPLVMGILNLTEDSFYSGSRISGSNNLLQRVEDMLKEGADILDIGAQSTRPGASLTGSKAERVRVEEALKEILRFFPGTLLSVDTYHAEVAKSGVEHGACLINDVAAGNLDPEMIPLAGSLGVPYLIMHMKGIPQNMQSNPRYKQLIPEILDFFIRKIRDCREAGIKDLLVDPGFGFGKTLDQNYSLLRHLDAFSILGLPLAIGISRKSMVYRFLETNPEGALNGTTALHMLALLHGASLLRVHDVRAARQSVMIWRKFQQQP